MSAIQWHYLHGCACHILLAEKRHRAERQYNIIIEQKCNQLARQLEFPGRVFVEPI